MRNNIDYPVCVFTNNATYKVAHDDSQLEPECGYMDQLLLSPQVKHECK